LTIRGERAAGPAPAHEEAQGTAAGRGRLSRRRILVVVGGQQDHGLEDPPMGNGRAMSICSPARVPSPSPTWTRTQPMPMPPMRTRRPRPHQRPRCTRRPGPSGPECGHRGRLPAERHQRRGRGPRDGGQRALAVPRLQERARDHVRWWIGGADRLGASREVLPFPAYGASKAALESRCRQPAVEGAPAVRVNLLHPGLIDTPLGRLASSVSSRRDEVKIPAGRQGTAWEIAYAALFLLSHESSYLTRQSLIVDGGLTTAPRA